MFRLPSPLEKLEHPMLSAHNVRLFVKRDDLIHPDVSGNKWRKLKNNLKEMDRLGLKKLVTFGGAFSNHIVATAAVAKENGFQAIGIIRGDELHEGINPTLKRASEMGMEFRFVSRDQFRKWRANDYEYVRANCPDGFIIPEGGANALGMQGVAELIEEIEIPYGAIISAVGTGTTLAGLATGIPEKSRAIGISVLKGDFIRNEVSQLLSLIDVSCTNYEIITEYHFGGYGKTKPELIDFMNQIAQEVKIKLDPIYTGKAFFGVWDMIERGKFEDQTLVFLHTGGLQGIAGYNQKNPQKIHY